MTTTFRQFICIRKKTQSCGHYSMNFKKMLKNSVLWPQFWNVLSNWFEYVLQKKFFTLSTYIPNSIPKPKHFLKHFWTFVDRNCFDIFDETNHLLNIIEGFFIKPVSLYGHDTEIKIEYVFRLLKWTIYILQK